MIAAIATGGVLVALVLVVFVLGTPRIRLGSQRKLWSVSQIHRYPLTFGTAKAPLQPLDAKGVPALLSSDPGVQRGYLGALARQLPPVHAPADVGFLGQVRRASSNMVLIHRDQLSAIFPGASFNSVEAFVHAATVDVRLTRRTALLLGGARPGSLPPGTEVLVGGRQYGGSFRAELLALATELQRPVSASSGRASASTATPAVSPSTYDLAADRTSRATARLPADPPSSVTTGVAGNLEDQQSPNSVELHDKVGVISKLPAFSFNPHFDATIGVGDACQLGVHADLLIANDYELHWPFQFVQDGTGFLVVSLDKPDPGTLKASLGPINAGIDAGITDPSNYTVYSGFGVSAALIASVNCSINLPFGRASLGFGVGAGNATYGSQNKTVHHVPLAGDRVLEIPPDYCGGVNLDLGPVSAGIEDCQYQMLSGGRFRATLRGTEDRLRGSRSGMTKATSSIPARRLKATLSAWITGTTERR